MSLPPKIDMREVTRLTSEGRLKEAMALLRGGTAKAPERDDARGVGHLPQALRGFLDRITHGPARGLFERHTERAPSALAGGRFEERSFFNAAGSRPYKLYIPSGHRGQALPLVVMLHGCTQSPDDFAAGTRMNLVAEEQLFFVAYPGQTQAANPSKCWNWFNTGDQTRERGEPSLIAGITREVMRDFPVDARRVYVAGLSAGGAAAAIMGSAYPDLYTAIGVHSGLACGAASDLSSAITAMRQGAPAGARKRDAALPAIVFHGDRDTTVNPLNGDQIIAESNFDPNLNITVHDGVAPGGIKFTQTVHADPTGKSKLEQWVLHGAGHAWSGGSPAGSFTEPRGPDASREMVRFFLQQVGS